MTALNEASDTLPVLSESCKLSKRSWIFFHQRSQVDAMTAISNSMPGFMRRTTTNTRDVNVRKILYLSLAWSKLGYASEVWALQTVTNLLTTKRLERRATKLILSLQYGTGILCKERRQSTGILPVCYWQIYLILTYLFKCIIGNDSAQYLGADVYSQYKKCWHI